MASLPNHVPHNSSSGLKPSYEPQNLPDLINDLRKSDYSDDMKLFVLNSYLHKCQEDLPVVRVPGSEPSEFRSMTLRGIEILKKEILRINKAIGLNVSATSMDFLAQDNAFSLMHSPDKTQIAKPSTDKTPSLFLNLGPSVEKGSASLFFQPKEKAVSDLVLRPLTQPIWKNNRRAWSDELHSRFVSVLQRLGGPEVATPKRIRDNMHVDGLTINQVKSHLQKYRLNLRESHPEGAAKKPEKLKAYYGAVAGTSEAGRN